MITKEEYLKALEIVEAYHEQIKAATGLVRDIETESITIIEIMRSGGMTTRLYNLLAYNEVRTVKDIEKMLLSDFVKTRGAGNESIRELRRLAEKFKIVLYDDYFGRRM